MLGQRTQALGELCIVDPGSLPQMHTAHLSVLNSSAAATAQLLLPLNPRRPYRRENGVGKAHPHSRVSCSEATSPISTFCAGTDVMYGETNCKNPRPPSVTTSSVRRSRTNTRDQTGMWKL